MIYRLFAITGLLLLQINAYAHSCGAVVEKIFVTEVARVEIPEGSAIKKISALSDNVTDEDMEVVSSIVREVNQNILSHTRFVEQVRELYVQVEKSDSNAYFMGFGQQILYTVRQMKIPAKEADGTIRMLTEHPIKTRPVTAHEFGHAVVNRTMYERVPEYKQFVDALTPIIPEQLELEKIGTKGRALAQEIQEELEKIFPDTIPEEITEEMIAEKAPQLLAKLQELNELGAIYQQKAEELNQLYQIAMSQAGTWQGVTDIFGAHNEFYADVIALAYSNNRPDAVSDALSNTRHYQLDHDKSEIRALNRHFAHRSNRIDNWKVDTTIHHRYAPTRYHVYHNYLHQPTHSRPKIQAQILDNIMRGIVKDMQWRLERGGVGRSPIQDNEELMRFIDEAFEQNPIDYSVYDEPMF